MNRLQGIDSVSLCGLAARYDDPIPSWFLAPIDGSKIAALHGNNRRSVMFSVANWPKAQPHNSKGGVN